MRNRYYNIVIISPQLEGHHMIVIRSIKWKESLRILN